MNLDNLGNKIGEPASNRCDPEPSSRPEVPGFFLIALDDPRIIIQANDRPLDEGEEAVA